MNSSLSLGTSKDFDSITGTSPILVYSGAVNPQITDLGGLSINLNNIKDKVFIEGNLPVYLDENIGIKISLNLTVAGTTTTTTTIPILDLDTGISLIPLDATVKVYKGTSAMGTPIYTETKTILPQEINIAALVNSVLNPIIPSQDLLYDVIPFQFVDAPKDSLCTTCCSSPCNDICSITSTNADYFVTLEVSQNITNDLLTSLIDALETAIDNILDGVLSILTVLGITATVDIALDILDLNLYLQPNYSIAAQEVSE